MSVSRHGLLDMAYPLREHRNSVQLMVFGGCCGGMFPDTVCWTRLRITWLFELEGALTHERRRKFITKIYADLLFRRVSHFEMFQDAWRSNNEILVYTGMLRCLVP